MTRPLNALNPDAVTEDDLLAAMDDLAAWEPEPFERITDVPVSDGPRSFADPEEVPSGADGGVDRAGPCWHGPTAIPDDGCDPDLDPDDDDDDSDVRESATPTPTRRRRRPPSLR